MSLLSDFFRGGKNPANAAMPYLNQIPGVGHEYYDPYIQKGQEAGGMLSEQFQKLMKDPSAFISALQEGYEPSKGYQFKKEQLSRELGNTAAAGGIAGTPYHQEQQGELVSGLLSEDMQQFLQNVLGAYGMGVQGEEDIYNKGFESSGSMADLLGGTLNTQAGLAFQGQSQKNKNQQSLVNMLAKLLAKGTGTAASGVLPGFDSSMFGGS